MTNQIRVFLHGRKFKRLSDRAYEMLRNQYEVKQIEIEILYYLSQKSEASSSEICRELDLNKGQVSTAMENLRKRGFVTAKQDLSDRRYMYFSMTKLGGPVIQAAEQIKTRVESQIFAGFSEKDFQKLDYLTERIFNNMDEIDPALP